MRRETWPQGMGYLGKRKGALCLTCADCDGFLAMGYERREARDQVNAKVGDILATWET